MNPKIETQHKIGDLVAGNAYYNAEGPQLGIITRMEWDPRWGNWHFSIDWINSPLTPYAMLKYREADIDVYKYNLREWFVK
jgi:hypothetical protein